MVAVIQSRGGALVHKLPIVGLILATAAGAGELVSTSLYWSEVVITATVVLAALIHARPEISNIVRFGTRPSWWQVLWLAIFSSALVLRVRTTEDVISNPVDPSAAYRIVLVTFVAAALLADIVVRKKDLLRLMRRGIYIFLFIFNVANLVSASWSIVPAWTMYRSVEFAVDSALVVIVASSLSSVEQYTRLLNWTWLLNGVLMLSVIAGMVITPEKALTPIRGPIGVGIDGVLPVISRNSVGQLAGILAVVAASRLTMQRNNRTLYIAVLIASMSLLVLAQTRSAWIPAVLSFIFIIVARKKYWLLLLVGVVFAVCILATNVASDLSAYFTRGQDSEQIASLNSRESWWALAFRELRERPLTGAGAYAGGRFVVGQQVDPTLASTHNTWVEVIVGTSIWGSLPLALLLMSVWGILLKRLFFHMRHDPGYSVEWARVVEVTAVLIILTGRSFFSSVPLIWHPSIEFLAIVGFAETVRRSHAKSAVGASRVTPPTLACSSPSLGNWTRVEGKSGESNAGLAHS